MDVMFLKEALFNGTGANAFKLGTVLTGGWFWVRITGCTLLYRGDDVNAIDFRNILAVGNASQIQVPDYIRHDSGSVHFYVVRRANGFGLLEHTFSAAVKVEIDADGNLVSPRPNGIFEVKAERFADNKVRLVWFYCPLGQKSKPACFKIYCDNGTGQNPLATVKYAGRRFYSYKTDALETGTYLFAVKAEDKNGAQGPPAEIKFQVGAVISETITILEAKAI